MGWLATHGAWVAAARAAGFGALGAATPAPGHLPWTANLSWGAFALIALVLVVVIVAGILAALWLRRMARMDMQSGGQDTFSLMDLRRLRDDGLLSTTEYEALREALRRHAAARAQEDEENPGGRLR